MVSSSVGSQILPLLGPFWHFPPPSFLKIIKKKTREASYSSNQRRGQTTQKEMRRVDPKLSCIAETALSLGIAEDDTCRRIHTHDQR